MNNNKEAILIDFDTLYDTEIGCCLYLYTNSKKTFFKPINNWSYYFLRYMVLTRKKQNPLSVIFKDEYNDSLDNIYNELIKSDEKWNKILKLSPPTNILTLSLAMLEKYDFYKLVINCKNFAERRHLKSYGNTDFDFVINENDYSKYSTFYIRNIKSLLDKADFMNGKSVFLYNFSLNHFNCDINNKVISEYAIPFSGLTEFNFIDPFKDFDLFNEEDKINDIKK